MSKAEYVEWTHDWNHSIVNLENQILTGEHAPTFQTSGSVACSLVAVRHIAKTGGVSLREWMLGLEQQERARYYGPATWMKFRGRCDGRKRYLFCCHPADSTDAKECRTVPVTRARSLAVNELKRRAVGAPRRLGGGGRANTRTAPSFSSVGGAASGAVSSLSNTAAVHTRAASTALLEFHWPDSALGRWGEPHTFLQMLPRMRPHAMPGCRVVVATVLRDPLTLYPSLQRHQYDAMREYGRQSRCVSTYASDISACNLTSCDVLGFVRAFPNFQAWRLTSPRWVVPPLEHVGHDAMYAGASRLISHLDIVGVTERLDDFLQLVCMRAGIAPCGHVGHRNAKHYRTSTKGCVPPDEAQLLVAVQAHAAADVRLHALATRRFTEAFESSGLDIGQRATRRVAGAPFR